MNPTQLNDACLGTDPIVVSRQEANAELMRLSPCPACGDQLCMPLMDEEFQPLATLAWPQSHNEAVSMKRLPLAFVRCMGCGHVYNTKFRYEEVPYSLQPNLMFNQGTVWSQHLEFVRNLILEYISPLATVVEIGCGDGHLLRALAQRRPEGRFIGFDPHVVNQQVGCVELRGELFVPDLHLEELRPQMLISRHVLEHMLSPLGFLQSIALASSVKNIKTLLFTEVPCIDRVFDTGRVEDFYYEHNSHFTTQSFVRMLTRANGSLQMLVHNYNREVISAIVGFGNESTGTDYAKNAIAFRSKAREAKRFVARQLAELAASASKTAIWGGTGKAAAFMNFFGVDAVRFPLVVDSDPNKIGSFVPGMGQKIQSRDALIRNAVDTVIIPMQWRARDIIAEMEAAQIFVPTVLIEHNGKLIDYRKAEHPY
ncbi:MAG TPA: class I SAM-dependent methyltransferase [Pirellulaceae bacterium]|nr:class I SAM-dependent methyltransferase [Pirellulaceae bacterium]HMO92771.1 class I SAM-dependent methyltransferase [Pirellulaceae bacterium]HMP69353.1 class I SAM-dependent methyltransferase [Pirellulaceae bacterium]